MPLYEAAPFQKDVIDKRKARFGLNQTEAGFAVQYQGFSGAEVSAEAFGAAR